MTYISLKLSRNQFVDFFNLLGTGRLLPPGPSEASKPQGEECLAIWTSTGGKPAPSTFVVEDASLRDFLAWVSTYARSYTPFTAHFRVMTWSTFTHLQERLYSNTLPLNERKRHLGALGLIVGEAFAKDQRFRQLPQMSLHNFKSTVSYPLSRALALEVRPDECATILDRAFRLQYGDSAGPLKHLESVLWPIWSELCGFGDSVARAHPKQTHLQRDIARCLIENGNLSPELLIALTENQPELFELVPRDHDTIEVRMDNLQRLLAEARVKQLREENRAALMGYSLSRVAPGTLDHLPQLHPLREHSPGMVLWYCFSAGCAVDSRIEMENMGLGRLLSRDITLSEDAFDYPKSDISVSELEIVFKNSLTAEMPRSLAGSLTVELYPRVSMVIRTGIGTASEPRPASFNGTQAEALASARTLVEQALRVLSRATGEERLPSKKKATSPPR